MCDRKRDTVGFAHLKWLCVSIVVSCRLHDKYDSAGEVGNLLLYPNGEAASGDGPYRVHPADPLVSKRTSPFPTAQIKEGPGGHAPSFFRSFLGQSTCTISIAWCTLSESTCHEAQMTPSFKIINSLHLHGQVVKGLVALHLMN